MDQTSKNHYSEDILLQYTLELLDTQEVNKITEHLQTCAACADTLSAIAGDIASLKQIDLSIDPPRFPMPTRKNQNTPSLFWAAALLIVGFALGLLARSSGSENRVTLYSQTSPHHAMESQIGESVICIGENLAVFTD